MNTSPNLPPEQQQPGSQPSGLSNRNMTLLALLLIAIAGGLGYWWYSTLEWEEKEIDLGYSKEALQNDFLAAEILLRNHGVQATTVKNLSLLDAHRWRNIALGHNDTLVLINANKTLTQERYDRLYEWVENGGTLITSTRNPFVGTHTGEEDLLLRDFGITPPEEETIDEATELLEKIIDKKEKSDKKTGAPKTDEAASSQKPEKDSTDAVADADAESTNKSDTQKTAAKKAKEKPENYYRCKLGSSPTEIKFADETKPLLFDFSRQEAFTYHPYSDENDREENSSDESSDEESSGDDRDLEDEIPAVAETAATGNLERAQGEAAIQTTVENSGNADETLADESQTTHLVYFEVGAGSIAVTSDNFIWSNRRIDCHDHAYALWSMVNPDGRVWFLINQDAPSLAAIIWNHAKYAVLAAVLALVLWLWAAGTRFGPIFVIPQQGRRSLAEHIHASAMLLWRKRQHPHLVKLLRTEISERLTQQRLAPQLHTAASEQQQIIFLQTLTGLTPAEIQHALFNSNLIHPQEFTKAIAHLQLIRKYL